MTPTDDASRIKLPERVKQTEFQNNETTDANKHVQSRNRKTTRFAHPEKC